MAGTITHEWNGTVLTITSDSGTSSADLLGPRGNGGPRGPQGYCGVILKPDGSIDTSRYATQDYVDEQIANVTTGGTIDLTSYATKAYVQDEIAKIETGDLTGYATEEYVNAKIAEAELGGGDVDLSAYALKSDIPTKVSAFTNDAGYLTQHQSLTNYATKSYVTSQGYQTAAQVQTAINNALGVIENGTY